MNIERMKKEMEESMPTLLEHSAPSVWARRVADGDTDAMRDLNSDQIESLTRYVRLWDELNNEQI